MDSVGILVELSLTVLAIFVLVYWIALPFILISKLNELIRLQTKANQTLDVLQHQWTAILRANLPTE